ncbi:MAG TPA: enhanced serine sensitivity protein SseB C-terminal domain-containing protein [Polyangiaceae bacterium]|jgi:hypothetical protein
MKPEFKPANTLEVDLVRATTDPGARSEFYRRLLESELFFLTPQAPENEQQRVANEGENLEIVCWEGPNGSFLPFFTSLSRLNEVLGDASGGNNEVPDYGFIAIKGRDAFPLIAQDPAEAVLNPGLPYAKPFAIDEIRAIADGTILQGQSITIDSPVEVMIGQPAVYPSGLAEALGALFARYPAVEAAHLAQIHDPKSDLPPHPIVGVVGFGCGPAVEQAGMIASALAQGPVDFVEMDPGEEQGLGGYLRRDTEPFYVKQKPA